MIYLENKIGVPQDIMIVKEVSTKKTNKAVTEQQAREISKEEAKAAVKCALKFKFKLDESGNEVIESVEPYGYQDIQPNKHRFFQNFFSTDETQKAHIGLYAAVFTQTGGSTGLTYGTINTWGLTSIKNTEEDPTAENTYYNYYVSFTVISPYTFTKYDVTVLSYFVNAYVEDTNTWKIIWKKAN